MKCLVNEFLFGRRFWTLILLSGMAIMLPAQTLEISGVVRDAESEEVIPLISVYLNNTKYGVNTNLEGKFELSVPPGTYSLVAKASGYVPYLDTLILDTADLKNMELRLRPVSTNLDEVLITSKYVNPANRVVKMAAKHRKYNRMNKIDAFEYEAYNKLVITMDNMTDQYLNNFLLKDVKKQITEVVHEGKEAHTDTSKYSLAVFFSESVSRYFYKKPGQEKEEIMAVKTTGMKEGEAYNLLNSMILQIDIYENTIDIRDKQFISPISDGALLDYEYQIINAEIDGRDTLFGLSIIPKRPYSLLFKGTMYIDNKDWAINRIDLSMNADPNINWVEDLRIRQEYKKKEGFWVPTMLDMEVDFQNGLMKRKGGDGLGLIGRSSSYLYDYKINEPKEPKFYSKEILEIKSGADQKGDEFWKEVRKSPLDAGEKMGIALVDSMQTTGLLDKYINIIGFIADGSKKFKYVKVGSLWYLLGFNRAEGPRVRLGVYSLRSLSERFYFGGHLAYGFRDQRFKYQAEGRYRIRMNPKIEIGVKKTYEVEQVGFEDFLDEGTSLFETMLRRVPLTQLNYYDENRLDLDADINRNLSGNLYLKTRYFEPTATFPFLYYNGETELARTYRIAEAGANFRFTIKEKFITSAGDRVYLGTNYPIFNFGYAAGFKGALGGQFDYHYVWARMHNKWKMGRFGFLFYDLKVGQYFGELPYPSLHVFMGNQTWAWRRSGFNMMNYYEFVADRYATLALEQNLDGMIMNKIPLLRRLKLKEHLTFRAAWGTLSPQNVSLNNVPAQPITGFPGQRIQAPDLEPYMEAGVGLSNILKVLRIEAHWRLNYHGPLQDRAQFRNFGRLNNFGLRAHLQIRL